MVNRKSHSVALLVLPISQWSCAVGRQEPDKVNTKSQHSYLKDTTMCLLAFRPPGYTARRQGLFFISGILALIIYYEKREMRDYSDLLAVLPLSRLLIILAAVLG